MPRAHELLLYAHRGASRRLPENTLEAYRRALDDGADALELDVHATRDGVVVASHDPDGRRVAGVARTIAASTLAEVRGWPLGATFVDAEGGRPFESSPLRMPTLGEVLAEFPGVPLNVDVKSAAPGVVPLVLAALDEARALPRVRLASFSDAVLAEIRRRSPASRTALGPREALRLALLPGALQRLLGFGGDAAQVPPRSGALRADTRAFVERAHGLGLRVDYWVVNSPAQARALLALGADGLMSDDPAAIVGEFRALRGR
jgi:glycerophosphoryl diester phosphodiesterase